MSRSPLWKSLLRDASGTAVIEAAFVLPILCMLSLGAYEAALMVGRNTELRSALDELAAVALASTPRDQAQIDRVKEIAEASTGLSEDQVAVSRRFRCGTDSALVDDQDDCAAAQMMATFLEVTLTDTYTPRWVSFGIGGPVKFRVTRTVQIG